MRTKNIKNLIYSGLGFDIELHDVEAIMLEGVWYPKIDVLKVAEQAIVSLRDKKKPLTKKERRFIATYFNGPDGAGMEPELVTACGVLKEMKSAHDLLDKGIESLELLTVLASSRIKNKRRD